MRILAFDTTSRSVSAAVLENGRLLAETSIVDQGTHSKRLMPLIDALLQGAHLRLSDIDGFATTVGPGSFTGLRIGISTLKGLAAATAKPVVGISSLDALAHQCTCEAALICPLLDARRGEVYHCRYRQTAGGLVKLTGEGICPPQEAVDGIDKTCAFIGDGVATYRAVLASVLGNLALFAPDGEHLIRAGTVARIGWRRLAQNDSDDPAALKPHYIRKSDAQRIRKKW